MTAAEWLARAHAVTDGATPGPWETFESSTLSAGCLGVDDGAGSMVLWHHDHGIVGGLAPNAAFIAESRTMLPAAVAAIEAVLAKCTETSETWLNRVQTGDDRDARWDAKHTLARDLRAAIATHLDPS